LVELAEQRKQYARDVTAAKAKADQERRDREAEMARLRAQEQVNRKKKFEDDYAKYRQIADSKHMSDGEKQQAWTLIRSHWGVVDVCEMPGSLLWDDDMGRATVGADTFQIMEIRRWFESLSKEQARMIREWAPNEWRAVEEAHSEAIAAAKRMDRAVELRRWRALKIEYLSANGAAIQQQAEMYLQKREDLNQKVKSEGGIAFFHRYAEEECNLLSDLVQKAELEYTNGNYSASYNRLEQANAALVRASTAAKRQYDDLCEKCATERRRYEHLHDEATLREIKILNISSPYHKNRVVEARVLERDDPAGGIRCYRRLIEELSSLLELLRENRKGKPHSLIRKLFGR
jgi:chorismate mutase